MNELQLMGGLFLMLFFFVIGGYLFSLVFLDVLCFGTFFFPGGGLCPSDPSEEIP